MNVTRAAATAFSLAVTLALSACGGGGGGGGGASDSDPANQSTNIAPVANAGASQSIYLGEAVALRGTASATNRDALTYSWKLMAPNGSSAQLSTATLPNSTFVPDVAGTYIAYLKVSDGKTVSTESSITVTVVNNTPPVAVAGPTQDVRLGEVIKLDGSASSDVNGDPLKYAWTLLGFPAGSNAVLTTPTSINPTFIADLSGSYFVTLIVSDGRLAGASSSLVEIRASSGRANSTSLFDGVLEAAVNTPDGGYIAVGTKYPSNTWILVRYDYLGNPASSFGKNGTTISDFNPKPGDIGYTGTSYSKATSVYSHPDGSYFVAGKSFDQKNILVKYTSSGALDQNFGINGLLALTSQESALSEMAETFKILGANDGLFYVYSAFNEVYRFRSDGALDIGFGSGGRLGKLPSQVGYSYSAAVMPNGGITFAGSLYENGSYASVWSWNCVCYVPPTYHYPALISISPDGLLLDTSKFTRDGAALVEQVMDPITFTDDGRALVAGGDQYQVSSFIARFSAKGIADSSFDGDGAASLAFINGAKIRRLITQPDGKVIAAGNDGNGSLILIRYNLNGTLDTSFGKQGVVLDYTGRALKGAAIKADGDILVFGSAPGSNFFVTTYSTAGVKYN